MKFKRKYVNKNYTKSTIEVIKNNNSKPQIKNKD